MQRPHDSTPKNCSHVQGVLPSSMQMGQTEYAVQRGAMQRACVIPSSMQMGQTRYAVQRDAMQRATHTYAMQYMQGLRLFPPRCSTHAASGVTTPQRAWQPEAAAVGRWPKRPRQELPWETRSAAGACRWRVCPLADEVAELAAEEMKAQLSCREVACRGVFQQITKGDPVVSELANQDQHAEVGSTDDEEQVDERQQIGENHHAEEAEEDQQQEEHAEERVLPPLAESLHRMQGRLIVPSPAGVVPPACPRPTGRDWVRHARGRSRARRRCRLWRVRLPPARHEHHWRNRRCRWRRGARCRWCRCWLTVAHAGSRRRRGCRRRLIAVAVRRHAGSLSWLRRSQPRSPSWRRLAVWPLGWPRDGHAEGLRNGQRIQVVLWHGRHRDVGPAKLPRPACKGCMQLEARHQVRRELGVELLDLRSSQKLLELQLLDLRLQGVRRHRRCRRTHRRRGRGRLQHRTGRACSGWACRRGRPRRRRRTCRGRWRSLALRQQILPERLVEGANLGSCSGNEVAILRLEEGSHAVCKPNCRWRACRGIGPAQHAQGRTSHTPCRVDLGHHFDHGARPWPLLPAWPSPKVRGPWQLARARRRTRACRGSWSSRLSACRGACSGGRRCRGPSRAAAAATRATTSRALLLVVPSRRRCTRCRCSGRGGRAGLHRQAEAHPRRSASGRPRALRRRA